jgi:hypothetical protein
MFLHDEPKYIKTSFSGSLDVLRASMNRHTIGDIPVWHSRIIAITTPVILREFITLILYRKESIEFAPSIIALFALGEAAMERDGTLVEDKMDVFCCFTCFSGE